MKFEEIVPAQDVLVDGMDELKGGFSLGDICLSGCISGEKKKDKKKNNEDMSQMPQIPQNP